MKNKLPFGLPSGDDPAAYAGARSTSAWRWEFLRRRSDYQEDWTRFHADWQAKQVRENADEPLAPGQAPWPEHFANIACMPGDAQRAKYGIRHLVDPACAWGPVLYLGVLLDRVERLRDAVRKTVPGHLRGWDHYFEAFHLRSNALDDALAREDIIRAYIDLRQPIGPQIKHLSEWAKRQQSDSSSAKPAVSRLREKVWRDYLRILDLERRGLSVDDIAASVYPHVPNDHSSGYLARHRTLAALQQAKHLLDTIALGH